jgi:hypothetical protein
MRGSILLSLPLGLIAYIGSGMIAAVLRGEDYFSVDTPLRTTLPWQAAPLYGLGRSGSP